MRATEIITEEGYRMIYVDDELVYEHRHIMELHLGRKLSSTELVHHRDQNKLNNAIENLEITDRSEHVKKHTRGFRSETHKQCTKCGEIKPRSEFYRKTLAGRDEHRPRCKRCEAADSSEWRRAKRCS